MKLNDSGILIEDIPFWPKPMAPICIHFDNQAAIGRDGSIMYNDKCHNRNLDPDETGVIDLSQVTDKPPYVVLTSARLFLVEKIDKFLFPNILTKHSITCIIVHH